jgi:hypothetical protein
LCLVSTACLEHGARDGKTTQPVSNTVQETAKQHSLSRTWCERRLINTAWKHTKKLEVGMRFTSVKRLVLGLFAIATLTSSMVGCQTTVGGQTLPSAYYLKDDVQYFPAGPEVLLTNTIQAIEQYKLDQTGVGIDPSDDAGPAF